MRNAKRCRTTAHWSSWADPLSMIWERHPHVPDHILVSLSQGRSGFHLEAAHESRDRLLRAGAVAPEWGDVDSSLCVLQLAGQPLDSCGYHRGACAHAGVLRSSWVPAGKLRCTNLQRGRRQVSVNVRVQDRELPSGSGAMFY